jgi:vacuolar-type H+-ATPase catalytic subunit A/Vma1
MDTTGKIVGVNGNMITVAFDGAVAQNEVGYACVAQDGREQRLMSEIVRIRGRLADMQVSRTRATCRLATAWISRAIYWPPNSAPSAGTDL